MAATFDEEDDFMLPLPEEPSSPGRPKLKRLKKASERQTVVHLPDLPLANQTLPPDSSEQLLDPLFPDSVGLIDELRKEKSDQVTEDEPLLPDSLEVEHIVDDDSIDQLFPDSGGLMEELRREKLEETKVQGPNLTHLEDEPLDPGQDRLDDGLDPLFPEPGEYKAWDGEEIGEGGLIEELRQEKSAKKCLNFNGEDELSEKETKKKKRKSREKADAKPKDPVRDKRRFEKERRVQLGMIHAESQRLLRETSDASFKPLPVVHKPISSVLEKIRLRKLEILKKSSASFQTSEIDSSVGVQSLSVDASDTQNMTKNDVDLDMGGNGDQAMHVTSSECSLEGEKISESHENRENGSEKQMLNPDISESVSKDEDKSDNAYPSNEKHNQSENDVADNEVDIPGSSMPCTNPAVPSDDVSSSSSDDDEDEEEEYYDKENIDPCSRGLSTMDNKDSRSTLLKDFVDDEAEEEDDSDHDLTRFPENDEEDNEDDESDEDEVMKDLIASGYKEGKQDHERRNELHLMWLEQQDAAKTDNVLQRLKYSNLQKEDLMDEVEEEDEDEGEGSGDDTMLSDSGAGAGGLKNILRQNSEKVKQMMMFNDDHDVYVPSDEDENEDHMLRRRILKQQPDIKTASLLENEESREVFGLIKKLNSALPPKRRGNHATSNLDMLTVGSNSNSFSKFFGRKASGFMTSTRKAVTGRSFIFGRDDSNSRSGLSSDNQSSENHDQSDMDPKERNQTRKPISSNLRSSQLKSSTAANSGVGSSSGSSLFEILRQSSSSSDKPIEEKSQLTETQATHIYSAFKVGRGFSRVDVRF